ncbi:MAG: crotonase [Magnetococcales bacterium]|nr:enoyl-CoA hydratase/isomerase family protein [Magnetococcales bacterium]NGZ28632.1 crotonase [Magnetococcales bacterium]
MENLGTSFSHWSLVRDQDNVAHVILDNPQGGANVLSSQVIQELERLLTLLEITPPKALLVKSGKAKGFIAGADINEFKQLSQYETALPLIRRGQAVMDKLAELPYPTVALIHGFCLGGGLELAMACRYRVASNEPSTRLGLPEVKLGLHPGFGGTVRLPALVGEVQALNLMLTGRTVGGKDALRMGLVDRAVPLRQLEEAARQLLANPPPPRLAPWWNRLPAVQPLRLATALVVSHQTAKVARKDHYPAPHALVDLFRRHGGDHPQARLAAEADSIARLLVSETAQNLVRVFFLRERLNTLGKGASCRPQGIHVVGAGVMGGDIAAWCALKGFTVTLHDPRPEGIGATIKRAGELFKSVLKRDHLVRQAMDRLIPDLAGVGVAKADLVIEAVSENPAIKQEVYQRLEPHMKPDAILATNTSSIPLEVLAQSLVRGERLVGLHFFNPVSRMPLVEVVAGRQTPDGLVERMAAFCHHIDRLPLPVKSAPGFLVNRLLMPYLLEAILLAQEGVAVEMVDQAAKAFGMPMGPLELADAVGLDICLSVAHNMPERRDRSTPALLQEMVSTGRLGRKSGGGFYEYHEKGKHPSGRGGHGDLEEMGKRLILPMLNEAMATLREGVVADGDLLDAGMVFGTGFAPFRGGPCRFAATMGTTTVIKLLEELASRHGSRFLPDAGWRDTSLLRLLPNMEVRHEAPNFTGYHSSPFGTHAAGVVS